MQPASTRERRIALMGYRSVGKSSLAIQFVQGQFVDHYEPTIENTFSKAVQVMGHEYHVSLVDTAGQDEYTIFPPEYSANIHGYVLVYSIDSSKSYEVCKILHEKLTDLMGGNTSVPLVLVGNKCDLLNDREVSTDEGRKLAEQMKAIFLETSAKNNQGVSDVFHRALAEMEKQEGSLPDGSKKCCIS